MFDSRSEGSFSETPKSMLLVLHVYGYAKGGNRINENKYNFRSFEKSGRYWENPYRSETLKSSEYED
jgi:hypothetical protein